MNLTPVQLSFILAILLGINFVAVIAVYVRGRTALSNLRQEVAMLNRNLLKAREFGKSKEEEATHLGKSLVRNKQDLLALEKKLNDTLEQKTHALQNMTLLEEKLLDLDERLQERDSMLTERDEELNRIRLVAEKAQAEAESLRESLDEQVRQFETYAASLMRIRGKIEEQLTTERLQVRKLQKEAEQLRRENSEIKQRTAKPAASASSPVK
jgi:chromosome segregation ATPase